VTTGDGRLLWQRLAEERGDYSGIPPQQQRATRTTNRQPVAPTSVKINQNVAQQPGEYVIVLSYDRPPLRSNGGHGNRYARARIARDLIDEVMTKARALHIPTGQHLTVQLHYAPGRRPRIDGHNLHPTVKPIVDALARPSRRVKDPRHAWRGLQLVPDDTDEYVTIPTPLVHFPPEPGPRCWVTVTVTPRSPSQ
jgi:crossover junction endodeoxyribonuclease RusA